MRICRTGVVILLSSAFFPAVAQRPAVTSHVTVIARDGKSKKVVFSSPRQVTEKPPSYFHGWPPDSKRFAYVSYSVVK